MWIYICLTEAICTANIISKSIMLTTLHDSISRVHYIQEVHATTTSLSLQGHVCLTFSPRAYWRIK